MHPALPHAVATAVASADDESCHTVSSALQKAPAATADAGDSALAKEMLFVAQVLGMLLAPSNANEPYRPMMVFGDQRSALPEDCDDAHLALLAELLPTVMAPDVAARIADVLWLRRRDVDHATRAVNHYLDFALQCEDFTHWTDSAERLERALRAILVERSYGNMRNRVAHGLMSAGDFFQASAIYFWWICLRYVLRAPFQSHRDGGAKSTPGT